MPTSSASIEMLVLAPLGAITPQEPFGGADPTIETGYLAAQDQCIGPGRSIGLNLFKALQQRLLRQYTRLRRLGNHPSAKPVRVT